MTWRGILLALLAGHVAVCVARIPHAVFWKRWTEIQAYQAEGDLENLFRRAELEGADVVRWLQANTPERSAILFAGEIKGAMEFAAAALDPRILVNSALVAPDSHAARGFPFAVGTLAGRGTGELVLHAARTKLRLELRR